MPIRQAQNARKRKTVLDSGEAEAQAIARQGADTRVTRGEQEPAKPKYSMSDADAPLLGRFGTLIDASRDRKEAKRLGLSVQDYRAQRASELVDPEGTKRGKQGRPSGPVPEGGEPNALGEDERRRRASRRGMRTVLSDATGGTRLGA